MIQTKIIEAKNLYPMVYHTLPGEHPVLFVTIDPNSKYYNTICQALQDFGLRQDRKNNAWVIISPGETVKNDVYTYLTKMDSEIQIEDNGYSIESKNLNTTVSITVDEKIKDYCYIIIHGKSNFYNILEKIKNYGGLWDKEKGWKFQLDRLFYLVEDIILISSGIEIKSDCLIPLPSYVNLKRVRFDLFKTRVEKFLLSKL